MKKVLYICMPFAAASWGSLALGTLKAIGQREGIESDVRYLNIPFVKAIGEKRYNQLRERIHSEICFTVALYADVVPQELWRDYLRANDGSALTDQVLGELENDFVNIAAREAPQLLDTAMDEINWDDYDIVGFTTGYNQTVASLALAHRIRARFPEKIIIFGGAACDGDMGPGLLDSFEILDVVVSGEADTVIVPLIRALRERQPVNGLPRVHARGSDRVVVTKAPSPAVSLPLVQQASSGNGGDFKIAMDDLPIPDYDDYFREIDGFEMEDVARITFESSRGCWWGQKHLCSFCGLNGTSLAYRAKSAEKVLAEIRALHLRYGRKKFVATDNIFDMNYFATLLPGLKALHEEYGINVFYETKSNIRTEQIRALSEAGVKETQPGIESFSDHILKLMDKGTNGLNQVRFLRDCCAYDIKTHYGILWGNPGETADDYQRMTDLIPFINHLPPPNYVVPVSLEKFSPYFMTPDKFEIRNIRPAPIYPVMFGGRSLDYARIAYIFYCDHDSDQIQELKVARQQLADAVADWKENFRPDLLLTAEIEGELYVADRRDSDLKLLRISGPQKDVFRLCEQPRTEAEIERAFPQAETEWIRQFLQQLVGLRLMLAWEDGSRTRYLALPVSVSEQPFYEKVLRPSLSITTELELTAAN